MNKALKRRRLSIILDYLLILLGSGAYALSVAAFIRPIAVPLGGVSGVSQVISEFTPLPMGVMIILINIPLFALSFKEMGRAFIVRTGLAMVWSSVLIDLLSGKFPEFTGDRLLAVLYGGVIMGAGLGLVFSRGATTGGTDIISKLVNKRFEHFSIGRVNMACNALVIVAAAIVFRSVEAALFAVVIQYVSGTVVDAILHGKDHASCALIVTQDADGVSETINREMRRGVTGLFGEGMYTKANKTVLLVTIRKNETGPLKRMVFGRDPSAFVIMLGADEVLGQGFKQSQTRG